MYRSNFGPILPHPLRQFEAIKRTRHLQRTISILDLGCKARTRLLRVGGFDYLISTVAQIGGNRASHQHFVIHDQHSADIVYVVMSSHDPSTTSRACLFLRGQGAAPRVSISLHAPRQSTFPFWWRLEKYGIVWGAGRVDNKFSNLKNGRLHGRRAIKNFFTYSFCPQGAVAFSEIPRISAATATIRRTDVQGLEQSSHFTLRTYGLDRCGPIASDAFGPPR